MIFTRPLAAVIASVLSLLPATVGTAAPAGAAVVLPTRVLGAATNTCTRLRALALRNATITIAQLVPAGSFVPPGPPPQAPFAGLPEFCRVAGFATPTSDSHIGFEVWIPCGIHWNSKYQQAGNGGYAGSIPYSALAAGLALGYAVAGTDDGHTGSGIDARWALGHPEKIIDFGYRALKETTDKAKTIIYAYTGLRPHRSYFDGCSDGGREALMEAERYPDDFDGIIVGSPANFWSRLLTGAIWTEDALLNTPASYVSPSQLPILTNAALALCAGTDGGLKADGFLTDPRDCHFDPTVVQCKSGQSASTCLTDAQVDAVKLIYAGLHNTQTHALLFPGLEPGGEAIPADWPVWITGSKPYTALAYYFGQQYFANFVFQNPALKISDVNFTTDVARADAFAPILNSTNPDLSRFARHGGKLIHYVGWSDSAIAPKNSLNYYDSVLQTMTSGSSEEGLERLQSFYRLYMVPGMAHCAGGPGANSFGNAGPTYANADADHNIVFALDRWVEAGVAPNRIIATKFVADQPQNGIAFQRPLCPYPRVSRYRGSGDTRIAANFDCVANIEEFREDVARSRQYVMQNYSILFNPRASDRDSR